MRFIRQSLLSKMSWSILIVFLFSLFGPGTNTASAEESVPSSIGASLAPSTDVHSLLDSGPAYEEGVDSNSAPSSRLDPQIDEFSGAFTYSYDLVSPPGRNDLAPHLTLDYNSLMGTDSSIVGYGWSLSIPSIERVNRTGTNNLYDATHFSSSLSGERLQVDAETYTARIEGGDFLSYRLSDNTWIVIDKLGTSYTFGSSTDFRQDDPEDSTRISRWMLEEVRDTNDNFISYSYTKGNGQIYPEKIQYTGHGSEQGNFTIEFELEDASGSVQEYSNGFEVDSTKVIKAITTYDKDTKLRSYSLEYTVGQNGHRVLLESITETAIASNGTITTLPSTDLSYQSTEDAWDLAGEWTMPYFTADGTQHAYELSSAVSGVIDVNADDLPDFVAMDDTSITGDPSSDYRYRVYLNTGSDWELDADWTLPYGTSGSTLISYELSSSSTDMVDVDGDGLPDFIVMDNTSITGDPVDDYHYRVYLNTGSGWELDPDWEMPIECPTCSSLTGFELFSANTRLVDINADYLPDFVVMDEASTTTDPAYYPGYYDVYLNTGAGWELSADWTMPEYTAGTELLTYDAASAVTQIMDVNGDELQDFVVMDDVSITGNPSNDSKYRVYLNTGTGWELDSNWTMPYGESGSTLIPHELLSASTGTLDVNADGLPDFVVMDDTSATGDPSSDYRYRVYLNTGAGWELDSDWTMPLSCIACGAVTGYELNSALSQMMDVNADSLPDFVLMDEVMTTSTPGAYKVFLNTGNGWVEDTDWDMPLFQAGSYLYSYDVSSESSQMLDVNGDGLLDFVSMDDVTISGDPSSDYKYRVYLNVGEASDRLSSISLATGAQISVDYTEEPIVDRNPYKQTMALYVVSEVTTEDGLGASNTTTYDYSEGKLYFHAEQYKSFTGFGQITKTESSGTTTKTFRHQGNENDSDSKERADQESKIGLPYRVEVYDSDGDLLQTETTLWENTETSQGADFPYKSETVTLTYDGLSSYRSTATAYTYDSYGNVKTIVNYGEVTADPDGSFTDATDLDEKFTITNTYAVDSTEKIRGKLSEQKVTNSNKDTLKRTRYFYDGLSNGKVTTGNLTKQAEWHDGSDTWYSTTYTYNSYGLLTSVKNPEGQTTTLNYGSYKLYPSKISNPKGYTVTMQYDYSNGQITSRTDENGFVTKTSYDGIGRILKISVPDPTTGTTTTFSNISYDDSSFPNSSTTTSTVNGVTSKSVVYFDGLGRTIQTNTLAEDGVYNTVDFWYDEQGNIIQESFPYQTISSIYCSDAYQYCVVKIYDALNRPTQVTSPTGTTTTSYSQWEQTVTDANGISKVYRHDAGGRLLSVEEANGSEIYTTNYEYDPLGQLISLVDAQGNERHFSYDSLGRKITQEDLHSPSETDYGIWSYTYDKNGNLSTQTDPAGQVITWGYDSLERISYEDWDVSTASRDIAYSYDNSTNGKMHLYQVKMSEYYVRYNSYDALGNVTEETRFIQDPESTAYSSYRFKSTYDLLGRLTRFIYPSSALTVNYTYNVTGALEAVTRGLTNLKDVVNNIDYSPVGQMTSITYANGVTTTNTYDPAQDYKLTAKVTTGIYDPAFTSTTSSSIQNLSYTYDTVGNITSIVDSSFTPTAKTISYGYDDLNRLLSASTSGLSSGDYSETYEYDALGNITYKSDLGFMLYEGTGKNGSNPHAVTEVAGTSYTYDANGNLTSNGDHNYTWDKRNRLIGSGSLSFSYDHNGSRYKTTDTSGEAPVYTHYLAPYEEVRNGTPTYYIFAGSQRVAALEGNAYTYYHQDHLGGTALTTNSSGYVTQIYDYYPYGSELLNSQLSSTDAAHSFTDKELEEDIGLYYFEARWYDPKIGRFLSEDPAQLDNRIFKLIQDPQDLNFYGYSRSNPISSIDPNGELRVDATKATQEEIDQFNLALSQLQTDVANNLEIQKYFDVFGIDLNYILNNSEAGPTVDIGNSGRGKGIKSSGAYGQYHSFSNQISIYDEAIQGDVDEVSATLIHELGHWANDVSDLWGNLNPDISQFSAAVKAYNHYKAGSLMVAWDGPYGYIPQIILYGEIDY